jgi:hypothetical protein
MSELPSDERASAAAGADPGRRKAAAQEARGALALTLAPVASPITVGTCESKLLRVCRFQPSGPFIENPKRGDGMKRACPEPSSTETLSSRKTFASGFSGSTTRRTRRPARTRKAKPTCQVNARGLGDAKVRPGFAIAYLRHSAKYMEPEVEARRAKRGVWDGDFVTPAEWRHHQVPSQ